jgi:hypothetical protein
MNEDYLLAADERQVRLTRQVSPSKRVSVPEAMDDRANGLLRAGILGADRSHYLAPRFSGYPIHKSILMASAQPFST